MMCSLCSDALCSAYQIKIKKTVLGVVSQYRDTFDSLLVESWHFAFRYDFKFIFID